MVMMVRRYWIGLAIALWSALAPVSAGADCAVCVDSSNIPCPGAAPQCFTNLLVGVQQCPMLGCFGAATSVGNTCGEGVFAYCAVIDGVPVGQTPTSTPTHTATSTATATATNTATGTATSTATATATATGTATSTRTATDTPTPVPQGGGCTTPAQCATGNCIDGTCCATASCPAGQSCDNPGNAGICSADPIAPAPAASNTGLLAMLGVLVVAAFVALRLRRA